MKHLGGFLAPVILLGSFLLIARHILSLVSDIYWFVWGDNIEKRKQRQHLSKVDFFKMEGSKKYTTIKRLNIKRR